MNTFNKINSKITELIITKNKNNGVILIDTKLVETIKSHSWYIKDGSPKKYVAAKINNKTVKLHRFITNVTNKKQIVDHIDRDTFNNLLSNLRITDSSTNNLNSSFSKNNTSGRTGVRYSKGQGSRSDFYEAQVTLNGNKKTKRFSINKYGKEEAFKLACEFRESFENEYNIQTAKTK